MLADSLQRSRVQRDAVDFEPLPESFIETTITARFKSIVGRYPGRMAVVDRNSCLTYKELDQESNRLAEIIIEHCGALPRPVALLLPQGVPAVIAILGILKARMFYVPFDCAAQEDWLRAVLSEVQPAVVLTDEDNLILARSVSPAGVTVLDTGAANLSSSNGLPPSHNGVADDTAYIFFTSGTTGRPKGVFDTHRNVLHNIVRYTNALAIRPDDRMSLLQSPAFSGSVSSLFCALLNGACIFPVGLRRESMGTLATWLREQAVTIYHSVPAIFRSIAVGSQEFPSIRIVRLEGDRGSKRDLERFLHHFPDSSVMVNGLGTTETGLVCQFFMDRQTQLTGETLPVGYPSADMQIKIVDKNGGELPAGRIGEIAVTSRYLAAGYWQRSDLTATAFQIDSADTGVRTYLTGDLGRVAEDGLLEHLGRADSKIRFRGQWIVPAVIEEVLAGCPDVEEAAVTVGGSIGNERLIAYFKYGGAEEPDVGELRKQLAAQLPTHSLPSRFVNIQKLPVTANGKIDRSALPKLDRSRPTLSTPYVASLGVLQRRLVELWCDVLELDQIGIRDDFFDLGGDSLLAVQMLTDLELVTAHRVPPDILLGNATIENITDLLLRNEDFRATSEVLNSGGELRPLFFLHGDYLSGGYYTRELARHLGPTRPVIPIRPCGLAGEPVPSSYREMATIHLEQIRAIQSKGPYLLGGNCNGGLVAFEISKLLAEQGETVNQLIMIDTSASNLRFERLRKNYLLGALTAFAPTLAERVFLFARRQLEWRRHHRGQNQCLMLLQHFFKRVASPFRNPARDLHAATTGATDRSVAGYWAGLRPIYQRIDHLYFPARYGGRIVVLWPQVSPRESLSEAKYWWERICSQIEIREIPGDNVTCLTKHVDSLARALNAALKN